MALQAASRGCWRQAALPALVRSGRKFFCSGPATRSVTASGSVVYESTRAVEEYLHFHYAPKDVTMPYTFGPSEALDFPARMAGIAAKHSRSDRRELAYDVGCSVGRGTFELTKTFDRVVGVDFSHAFVDTATLMKEKGELEYEATEQALLRSKLVAKLPADAKPERAEFKHGCACLLGDIGSVDCITAVNLLCRIPDPSLFFQKAIDCIRPGGILVLVSPYSWLEEYTPKDKWFGGKLDESGKEVSSHEAVSQFLGPYFELEARSDEAFLLREHARKFQWGVSDCTVWRRK